MTHFHQVWPWWRWALTGLGTLALALSTYLGWHYLAGGSVIGCAGGSACDQVLNSRWSTIGGVLPVSGLAMGTYLAILTASLYIGSATAAAVRRLAWRAMLVLAGAAAGSAVWFFIVQRWMVGAFCPYCMATHATGLLLAVLIFWQAPRQSSVKPATISTWTTFVSRRVVRHLPAVGLASAGLALAGILAAAQVRLGPPTVYLGGEWKNNLPALDPHAVPLVGSRDASTIVILLFDYECPHCQQLHLMLDQVVRRYNGRLAFILCPSPLNTKCNPYIPQDVDEFKDSCELARIALAVWVANREAFPAFNHWMFSFEAGARWRPRSVDAAKTKAIELVGLTKFNSAKADPWIDRYLQSSIQIYGDTVQSGNNAVPKLVFGSRWIIPQPDTAEELSAILRDKLAIPGP